MVMSVSVGDTPRILAASLLFILPISWIICGLFEMEKRRLTI